METLPKLNIKLRYRDGDVNYDPKIVNIQFKSVKQLRDFINKGFGNLFEESDGRYNYNKSSPYYKLIRISKIKHCSIEAEVCRVTLREFNLERLGI